MSWNYRIVKRSYNNDEESSFDICEVYYNEDGNPTSYTDSKNVLSQDSYQDLLWSYKEIEKAFKAPVLEVNDGKLIELKSCPKCGYDIEYETMDIMGDGKEEDFGKTTLVCTKPKGCGYMAIRQIVERNHV